jgi:hypothetical protein
MSVSVIMLIGFGIMVLVLERRQGETGTLLSAPTTTIFDSRLNILWTQMRKGSNTYYLPSGGNVLASEGHLGNVLEGKVRWGIRQLGINVETLPAFRPGNGPGGRAFLVGYAFPVPPTSSVHLVAELVAGDGTHYPLRSAAGGGGGPPERSWNLWTIDALPPVVSHYALQLKEETNRPTLAEIKFAEELPGMLRSQVSP